MAKGYSFAALVDVLYPFYKTSIGNGVNLNDFNSAAHVGVYVQESDDNALSGSNYPAPYAGCLEVLPNPNGVIQRYTAYAGNNATYVRSNYSGTWYAWKRYLTDNIIIYDAVYPVGICIQFDANVNPNTAFPGTTWAQIVDGRQVRAAENADAIGKVDGSDTVYLQETHLAAHVHSVPVHSHTIATHSHTISQHQHTVSDHTHPISHGHTAWTDNQGGHQHYIANGATQTGTRDAITLNGWNYLCGAFGPAGFGYTEYALKGDNNGADRGLTNSSGVHGHNVGVSQLNANSGGADRTLYASLDGPTATGVGGPSATGSTAASNTGSAGSATPVAVAGAWHKYAIWKRTA